MVQPGRARIDRQDLVERPDEAATELGVHERLGHDPVLADVQRRLQSWRP